MIRSIFRPLFAILAYFALITSTQRACNHDKIMNEKFPQRKTISRSTPHLTTFNPNMTINEEKRRMANGLPTNFKPIRIDFCYSLLKYELFSDADRDFWLNTMFPSLKSYFEQLLKVFPSSQPTNLRKNANVCWDYTMKEDFSSNSDLVLILINEKNSTADFVAWAMPCLLDPNYYNRPSLGMVNINLAYMNCTFDGWTDCFETMAHELIHVFGLNAALYDDFIDEDGNKRLPSQVYEQEGKKYYIKLESVVNWARIHFNCSTLTRVLLEDEGGGGSAGSHWDASILREEMMNPMVRTQTHATNFTLKLLEATGWYLVNYDMEQRMIFGRNAGCDFVSKICKAVPKPREYDCITSETDCQLDYTSIGYCRSSLFSNECPISEGHSNLHCYIPDREIKFPQIKIITSSKFGEKSSCIKSTIKPKSSSSYYGAGCYKTECYQSKPSNDWILGVKINDEELNCTYKNQILSPKSEKFLQNYDGAIKCPDVNFFCNLFVERCYKDCNNNFGYCAKNNVCYFFEGLGGCSPECISCKINPNMQQICDICSTGYYLNEKAGTCIGCIRGCNTCNDALSCIQCHPSFTLYTETIYDDALKLNKSINKCTPICPRVLNDEACIKCKDDGKEIYCTECLKTSFLNLKGKCEPCLVEGCETCHRNGSCQACVPSRILRNGTCRECDVKNCDVCEALTEDHCIKCQEKREFDPCTNNCEWKCIDACLNCTGPDEGSCVLCKNAFYLQAGSCKSCSSNCLKCEKLSECSLCGNNTLLMKGACVSLSEIMNSSYLVQSYMISFNEAIALLDFLSKKKSEITNTSNVNSKVMGGLKTVAIISNSSSIKYNFNFLINSVASYAIPSPTSFFQDLDVLNRIFKETFSKINGSDFDQQNFEKTLNIIQRFEEYYANDSSFNYSTSQIDSIKELQGLRETLICLRGLGNASSEYFLNFESKLFVKAITLSENVNNLTVVVNQESKRRVLSSSEEVSVFLNEKSQKKLQELTNNSANIFLGVVSSYNPFYYRKMTVPSPVNEACSLPVLRIYYSSTTNVRKIEFLNKPETSSSILIKLPTGGMNASNLSCYFWNDSMGSWSSDKQFLRTQAVGQEYLICESNLFSGFFRLGRTRIAVFNSEESIRDQLMNFGFYISLLISCSFVLLFVLVLFYTKNQYSKVLQMVTNNSKNPNDFKKIFGILSFLRTKKSSIALQLLCLFYINLSFNASINSAFFRAFFKENQSIDEKASATFIPISLISFIICILASFLFGYITLHFQNKDAKGNILSIRSWFWALTFFLIACFCILATWAYSFAYSAKKGAFLLASWIFTEFWKLLAEWLLFIYVRKKDNIDLSLRMFLMSRGYFN